MRIPPTTTAAAMGARTVTQQTLRGKRRVSCRSPSYEPPIGMRLTPRGLQAAINRHLAETNDNPKPFTWTADPDAIIEKIRRGK